MDFFNVSSVEEVKAKLDAVFLNYRQDFEIVPILESLDRVLTDDIISKVNVPPFKRSTVDGYAIISTDSHGASDFMPAFLNITGEVSMGEETSLKMLSGQAVYVPTGGMIPGGADSVVMIEYIEKLDETTIAVYKPVAEGENIIGLGDDIKAGNVILHKGKNISPQDIGCLAAVGVAKVKVCTKLKFYIISTGDEIIDLNEELTPGKIRDINGYAIYSLIKKAGGEIVKKVIIKDSFDLLISETSKAVKLADIVLISGGSSVGVKDYTFDVINSFEGKGVFVHGVSIKPGKPTIIGEAMGKAIFGLPGHPVSSIIIFKVFVEYLMRRVVGVDENAKMTTAIMASNVHSSPGKEYYQMVTLEEREGKIYALPVFGKSGMITLLSKATGYIVIKPHQEGLSKDEAVKVYYI